MNVTLTALLDSLDLLEGKAIVEGRVQGPIDGGGRAAHGAARGRQGRGGGEVVVLVVDEPRVQGHQAGRALLDDDGRLEMGGLRGGDGGHAHGAAEGVGGGHLVHVHDGLSRVDRLLVRKAVRLLGLVLLLHGTIVVHVGGVAGELLRSGLRIRRRVVGERRVLHGICSIHCVRGGWGLRAVSIQFSKSRE